MAIQKMRHIDQMTAVVSEPLRAENLRSAFELSEACLRLRPGARRPGVRRYRSIEEAAREQER